MNNLQACALIIAAEIPEEAYQIAILVLSLALVTALIIAPWKADKP